MTNAKWTIPDTLDPLDTVCVQVQVPKDDKHIAAFWGALGALQYSWNWQDSYGDGSIVAYVWRDVIETAVMAVRNGTNCDMPIDCAEVEACLATSAIIASLQAQITANDGDISDLEAADITLQNNIDTNTAGLAAHGIRITDNENDIASLQLDAAAQAILIQANTDNIALNDIELADHEARITVLEAGGGGGGGISALIKPALIRSHIQTNIIAIAGNETSFVVDPADGYSRYHVIAYTLNDTYNPSTIPLLFYNDDTNTANYRYSANFSAQVVGAGIMQTRGSKLAYPDDWNVLDMVVDNPNNSVYKTATSTTNRGGNSHIEARYVHRWRSTAQITKLTFQNPTADWAAGSLFLLFGEKEIDILVPDPVVPCDTYQALDVVDFDNNICYTLPVGQMGTIEANGNPNNCLWMDNPVTNDYIEVEIDLGQNYDIGVIQYDVIADQNKSISRKIWIDDVLIWDSSGNFTDATWHLYATPDSNTVGQVVRVRVDVNESHTRIGLDNIEIGII